MSHILAFITGSTSVSCDSDIGCNPGRWISGVAPLVSAITVDTVCRMSTERALKALLIFRSGMGGHTVDQRCHWPRIVRDYLSGATVMKPGIRFTCVLMVLFLLLPLSPQSLADSDHERARAALESGEILPLQKIIAKLEQIYPGQILEVELDRDDGLWIYEIKLVRDNGVLIKIELDASDGRLLAVKGRDIAPIPRPEGQR